MKNKKIFLVSVIIVIFIIQLFASKIGTIIANTFNYNFIDKDNIFMNITVHHIIQMILALLIMYILNKTKNIQFNLKPIKNNKGIKYTIIFIIIISIYVILSYLIGYKFNSITPYQYELSVINIIGTLAFQLFISGTSEEILFRALPISILKRTIDGNKNKFIMITTSILFSIAHISWTISSMSISFSIFQLVYAFILGLAYGFTYIKSKSIIYPIIMHGMSNFLMVGIGYVFQIMI